MRILALLLLLCAGCTTTAPNFVPIDTSVLIKRSSMWVPDLDRAIVFFHEVVGLEIESRKELNLDPDSVLFELFSVDPKAKIRRVLFSSPSQERVLFVMESEGAPKYEEDDKRSSILVIRTDDMDGVIARARQNGFTVGNSNTSTSPTSERTTTETTIFGPAGNAVLMYQTTIAE